METDIQEFHQEVHQEVNQEVHQEGNQEIKEVQQDNPDYLKEGYEEAGNPEDDPEDDGDHRVDWTTIKVFVKSRPKTLDADAKLSEDDIFLLILDHTGEERARLLANMAVKLADLVQTFVEFYRIEDLDESTAVDRAQEMFSKLDADNDGDITEQEFLKACLEDDCLLNSLGTKHPFSGKEKKEEVDPGIKNLCRFSMAAENRVTTKRRYSDICTKKRLFYNS